MNFLVHLDLQVFSEPVQLLSFASLCGLYFSGFDTVNYIYVYTKSYWIVTGFWLLMKSVTSEL